MSLTHKERCSCGAEIEVSGLTSAATDARIEKWRKSHKHPTPPLPPQPQPSPWRPVWQAATDLITGTSGPAR